MGGVWHAGDIISILDKRTEMSRNRRRQTVLLSATLHANLGKLATLSLTHPVSVGIRYCHASTPRQHASTALGSAAVCQHICIAFACILRFISVLLQVGIQPHLPFFIAGSGSWCQQATVVRYWAKHHTAIHNIASPCMDVSMHNIASVVHAHVHVHPAHP